MSLLRQGYEGRPGAGRDPRRAGQPDDRRRVGRGLAAGGATQVRTPDPDRAPAENRLLSAFPDRRAFHPVPSRSPSPPEEALAFQQRGESTSYKQTDAALTGWKKTEDLAFLSEVSSVPLQQALRHRHTAFANFFAKRGRYPRFKSRNCRQSAHYTRSAFRIKTVNCMWPRPMARLPWPGRDRPVVSVQ